MLVRYFLALLFTCILSPSSMTVAAARRPSTRNALHINETRISGLTTRQSFWDGVNTWPLSSGTLAQYGLNNLQYTDITLENYNDVDVDEAVANAIYAVLYAFLGSIYGDNYPDEFASTDQNGNSPGVYGNILTRIWDESACSYFKDVAEDNSYADIWAAAQKIQQDMKYYDTVILCTDFFVSNSGWGDTAIAMSWNDEVFTFEVGQEEDDIWGNCYSAYH